MAKSRAIGFGIENLPRIVRGEGSYLIDDAGRRYLDGSGGPDFSSASSWSAIGVLTAAVEAALQP